MRRVFGRLLFGTFLVGQLQLIPAVVVCVRQHQQPAAASHCGEAAHVVAGASLRQAQDAGATVCTLFGPCATSGFAVTPSLAATGMLPGDDRSVPQGQPSRPDSFDPPPPAPPPQA